MGVEIERKFLVRIELLPQPLPEPDDLEQGYLSVEPAVRVRIVNRPDGTRHAELTVKGKGLLSRTEFNYPIPASDAEAMMQICSRSLRKLRRRIGRFDVDHFLDRDLWLAEIELRDEREEFERPAWLGDEVTDDARYSNARLASPRPSE
jgi:adenylate cyclase